MKRIIQKTSITNEQKLEDLLRQTEKHGECLVWFRALNTDGYPHMLGNVKVHRLVYELQTKENINGKVIRHTCDNPKCINPEHLISGTAKDNMQDMMDRDRHFRKITPDIIKRTRVLLNSNLLSQKEIANILGINPRRVSDIFNGKYSDSGKFLGRG